MNTPEKVWRQRAVRVLVSGISAGMGPRAGLLVNLSIAGALMRLDGETPLDVVARVVFTHGADTMDVAGRIVRCEPAAAEQIDGDWLVAVQFMNVSETARVAIPRFLAAIADARGRAGR